MKFFIIFASCLALALANYETGVVKSDSEVNVNDFKYAYAFEDGHAAEQQGQLNGEVWNVNGKYEYNSPEGEKIFMIYAADDNGYHVVESNPPLPTPPPIPEAILRSLEYIKSHPSAENKH